MTSQRISNIEAGRGIAALLVVLFHTDAYYFETSKYWIDQAFGGFFKFGYAGVDFFFVLSGFIMLTVHRLDFGQPSRVSFFIRRRFERIYPFFWVILTITVILYYLNPSLGEAVYRSPFNILQSAILVGLEPFDSVVFVSWTMWHEVLFYFLFAIALGWPRVGIPAIIIWIFACMVVEPFGLKTYWPPYLTMFINILFALGMFCYFILSKFSVPAPRLVLASGALVFVSVGLSSISSSLMNIILYGIGAALCLLGAVESERRELFFAPKSIVMLGQASYAIYLTHMLTLAFIAKAAVWLTLPRIVPAWIAFVTLATGATVVGLFIHLFVERPVLKYVRGAYQYRHCSHK